jgi:hypothetical protein
MVVSSEPRRRRLGLLFVFGAGIAFALFAPIGLLTTPLAAMVLVTRARTRHVLAASFLTGVSLWWLAQVGNPPDQVLRVAAVVGSAVFGATLATTKWSHTHRALVSMGMAAGIVSLLFTVTRVSWPEVRWWVESRIQFAAQTILTRMSGSGLGDGGDFSNSNPMLGRVDGWFDRVIPLMADYFPATVAVQMFAGFALAAVLLRRIAPETGADIGRFRDFRFSEHLGWIAVVSLALVLMLRASALKLLAANMLVVAGALYALRGSAVVIFGLVVTGGPGLFTTGIMAFLFVFMLPVVITGAILLGVVDAGVDLRQRWTTPQKGT